MAYKHINTNTSVQVQPGATRLTKVVVGTTGTAWNINIYNGNATTNDLVAVVNAQDGGNYDFETLLPDGLYVVTSGTTPGDATIVFG